MRLEDLRVKHPITGYMRPARIEDLIEALEAEGGKIVENPEQWSGTVKHPITGLARGRYLVVRL